MFNDIGRVDVVIPVYRPGNEFKNIISRLLKQTVVPDNIFLLQTIEGDSEQLIKYEDDRIKVYPIKKKDFDHGATRHFGASLSNAEYIMFMTQDAVPYNNKLIENIVKPFEDKKIGAVYGRQLAGKDAGLIEKLTRVYNYPKTGSIKTKADIERLGIKAYFCSNVCAVYRKELYDKLGGFVQKTIFNEDMIMASKIINSDFNVVYCEEAMVVHSHSYTCMQQFRRNFDLGVSQKQYNEVFENISSVKEGSGYAKKMIIMLLKKGHVKDVFYFALQCAFKLAGYKLGKNYDRLPKRIILGCTMNKGYWN